MTFFMTNNAGMLSRRAGANLYGEFTYATPVRVKCAVVKLIDKTAKTSVRTDQSGTRGNAEEETVQANILFPPSVAIKQGDRFVIAGISMRVTGIDQKFDILGAHDHDEVTLEHLQ